MRLLICGDRHWSASEPIATLLSLCPPDTVVIHGAAPGADSIAGRLAAELGFEVVAYPAKWAKYGPKAGPIRNSEMLMANPDEVHAFHNSIEASRGTKDMVEKARKAGIPTTVHALQVTKPEALYHFTCKHSKAAIGTSNCLLLPMIRHPLLGCKVLWLTTEAKPDREQTGLTMNLQKCDRMQFRYVVNDLAHCRPWLGSLERAAASEKVVADLESFGDPEHWWIADAPVRAHFDRSWQVRDEDGFPDRYKADGRLVN